MQVFLIEMPKTLVVNVSTNISSTSAKERLLELIVDKASSSLSSTQSNCYTKLSSSSFSSLCIGISSLLHTTSLAIS